MAATKKRTRKRNMTPEERERAKPKWHKVQLTKQEKRAQRIADWKDTWMAFIGVGNGFLFLFCAYYASTILFNVPSFPQEIKDSLGWGLLIILGILVVSSVLYGLFGMWFAHYSQTRLSREGLAKIQRRTDQNGTQAILNLASILPLACMIIFYIRKDTEHEEAAFWLFLILWGVMLVSSIVDIYIQSKKRGKNK